MSVYLRFVVAEIDEDSERALGVFQAMWNLRNAGKLHAYEEDHYDSVRWWFNANLARPTRFTAAKAPFWRKRNRALSWFKDSAIDHIAQIRELVEILESHHVHVRTLKSQAGWLHRL